MGDLADIAIGCQEVVMRPLAKTRICDNCRKAIPVSRYQIKEKEIFLCEECSWLPSSRLILFSN